MAAKKEAVTLAMLAAKRKHIWENGSELRKSAPHDLQTDKDYIEMAARTIRAPGNEHLMREVVAKPYLLIEICFCVVDKHKQTVPFFFNAVQKAFIDELEREGTDRPFFILKGRQQGFTTLITAIQLSYAIVRNNFEGFTIANSAENTETIFTQKARVVFDRLPEVMKPHAKYSNKREFLFDNLNSYWGISTATEDIGRSHSFSFVHFSEVAFYSCSLGDLQAAINPTLVPGALIIYETTANGFNEAKALWDGGSCVNLFFEWWRTPEYRSDKLELLNTDDAWLAARLEWLARQGLDDRQRAWYAETYNSYIDHDKIKQEYPCTPEEAFIFSGEGVFDAELLAGAMNRAQAHPKLTRRGYFTYRSVETPLRDDEGNKVGSTWELTDIQWVDDKRGMIKIHEEPRLLKEGNYTTGKCPYVIGADTAGSGNDYFAAKVIDNMTKKTVATLHKRRIDDDLFAEQLICLGRLYHDALISVEANFSKYPILILTRKYAYDNLYYRERYDKTYDERTKEPGFMTTAATKPAALNNLVATFREFPDIEPDEETLHEMSVFVRKENGRMEAVDGEHDDLVMALSIAHMSAGQQTITWIPVKVEIPPEMEWFFGKQEDDENLSAGMGWDDF